MDRKTSTIAILGAGALVAVIIAAGQDGIPGSFQGSGQTWKLKNIDTPGMVRFTVERRKPGSRWNISTDVRLANFRGLSREMFDRSGPAKFEYVQDAGSLVCEGSFSWNGGSGTFHYQRNPQFASEFRSLGYITPDEDQLFNMILGGVTLEFARTAHDAGLSASTAELIEMRSHGVSTEYIHDAVKSGYRDLLARDYIELKNHGISAWFLRDLKSYGYNLPVRDIVELSNHGVSSEFVGDLKNAGYQIPANQITELSSHGVDSRYVRELKNLGLKPGATDLVNLKNHGVSTDFLRGLKDAGYGDLAVSDVVDLTAHGVDVAFIQEARDLGYNFSPPELIELHSHGVDAAYLQRLRDVGMKNLNAGQIEKLHSHGVD